MGKSLGWVILFNISFCSSQSSLMHISVIWIFTTPFLYIYIYKPQFTSDVSAWLQLHSTHFQAINGAHPLPCHCNRLFYRASKNTSMVDRVLLRPFNSSGTTRSPRPGGCTRSPWLPSAEKGAYCFTHAGAKKLMMTYFTLFLHINYPINISITAPVKAEDSTSQWLTERTGFGPSHKSHRVHLVSHSLFLSLCLWFVICNPAHRIYCVWWTEDALEGNEMIPHLKWMGLINTTQIEDTEFKERDFVRFAPWKPTAVLM